MLKDEESSAFFSIDIDYDIKTKVLILDANSIFTELKTWMSRLAEDSNNVLMFAMNSKDEERLKQDSEQKKNMKDKIENLSNNIKSSLSLSVEETQEKKEQLSQLNSIVDEIKEFSKDFLNNGVIGIDNEQTAVLQKKIDDFSQSCVINITKKFIAQVYPSYKEAVNSDSIEQKYYDIIEDQMNKTISQFKPHNNNLSREGQEARQKAIQVMADDIIKRMKKVLKVNKHGYIGKKATIVLKYASYTVVISLAAVFAPLIVALAVATIVSAIVILQATAIFSKKNIQTVTQNFVIPVVSKLSAIKDKVSKSMMSEKFSKASAYLMMTEHQSEDTALFLDSDTPNVVDNNQQVVKERMDTKKNTVSISSFLRMFLSSDKQRELFRKKLCDRDFISNNCNFQSGHGDLFIRSIKDLVQDAGSRKLSFNNEDLKTLLKLLEKFNEDFCVVDSKIVKKDATLNGDRSDSLFKVLLTGKEFDSLRKPFELMIKGSTATPSSQFYLASSEELEEGTVRSQ